MTSEVGLSNVPASTVAASGPAAETAPNDLGQDAFLQLLMTQIQNQNPLDPSDPSEFLGQLASFSSLEQMGQINEGIDSLAALQATGLTLQNVNLVGKTVVTESDTVPVVDGEARLRINTTTSAEKVVVEYMDGGVLKTQEVDTVSSGVQTVTLEDLSGPTVKVVKVTGYKGGEPIDQPIKIYAVSKVDGLTFEGGVPMLMLGSVLQISPSDVLEILDQ